MHAWAAPGSTFACGQRVGEEGEGEEKGEKHAVGAGADGSVEEGGMRKPMGAHEAQYQGWGGSSIT